MSIAGRKVELSQEEQLSWRKRQEQERGEEEGKMNLGGGDSVEIYHKCKN